MQTASQTGTISKGAIWTGRVLSGLVVLFLTFDGVMKLVKPPVVVQGSAQLGFPESAITGVGIVLLICTLLYAIPHTSVLGEVLLTGYLGGAVATQLRVGMPLFSNTLFPVYFGVLLWLGLYLRDERLRAAVAAQWNR